MDKVTKVQMIAAIAEKTELTKTDVSKVVGALVDQIVETIASGKQFGIIDFGTFKPVVRKAREGRNPSTGKPIKIKEATVPRFVPGKKFKEAVNAPKKPARKTAKKAKK